MTYQDLIIQLQQLSAEQQQCEVLLYDPCHDAITTLHSLEIAGKDTHFDLSENTPFLNPKD